MGRVKIAFIGVGNMGQCAHLRHYASLPECEVIALAELRPELGRRVAEKYGIPKTYIGHEELLANEQPDALVAAQPFTRHAAVLTELAKAGLPIFIEKPLASSVPAGERVLQALAEHNTWLMVGYHKRSDPATIWAKAEIERLRATGELGALRYVRITMPPGDWVAGGFFDLIGSTEPLAPLETDPPPPDLTPDHFAAYVKFVNYYIHQVNLLRHLLGEDYSVRHADPAGVLLVAESASGVTGLIEMAPYNTTRDWQEVALVCFERGYVKIELPAPLVLNRPGVATLFADPGDGAEPRVTQPVLPPVSAMRQQALAFLAAVRGEAAAPCLADEALRDLQVAREYLELMKKWSGS